MIARIVAISSNQCVVGNEHFFIRGVAEIRILDTEELFAWGVWISRQILSVRPACGKMRSELTNPPTLAGFATRFPATLILSANRCIFCGPRRAET
jgi:hypothetical protein